MLTNALYIIDVFVIFFFFTSYFLFSYRRGYRIDIWHYSLFMSFILSGQIMFPFDHSELNIFALGGLLEPTLMHVDEAYIISTIGFICVIVGAGLWKVRTGLGLRRFASRGLFILPYFSRDLMSSKNLLVLHSLLALLLEGVMLTIYFMHSGFGFDFRKYYLASPEIRPLANFSSDYVGVISAHCFARYLDTKEKMLLLCCVLPSIGLLFFGSRGAVFSIYLMAAICYLMQLGRKLKLIKLITIFGIVLIVAIYLTLLRGGDASLTGLIAGFVLQVFYGNSFSDIRDFGTVLAFWDGHFFLGKTYLAALFAFVPRVLSSFRDKWAIGVVTATMVGFDPAEHPGLRPGPFGESYLNFGYVGVILLGLLVGSILMHVDRQVKRELENAEYPIRYAYSWTLWLTVVGGLTITSGIANVYVLLFILLTSWVMRRVVLFKSRYVDTVLETI